MQILMNTGGIAATNCYLVADEVAKSAVLFDAPNDTTAPLLDAAEQRGWDMKGLWLTHGHFDHLADHAVVKQRFPNAQILIHPLDESKLADPGSRMFPLPFTIPPGKADGYLKDDQQLSIGNLKVHVLFTPGHSPGHVAFHFPDEKIVIGGDLIIMGSVGRTDLPDSNETDLFRSLKRIMKLPMATKLLSGHGPSSTLGRELEINPYVRTAVEM